MGVKIFIYLQLCLSLTSLKQYRAALVEGLKGVISKMVLSIKKKKDSGWFSSEIGEIHHPSDLLSQVIQNTCTYGSWALIGDGVVDLAFMLLDMSAGLATVKVDQKLKTLWNIGENLLKTVVKVKLDVAEIIIKQLSKRIMLYKAASKVRFIKYTFKL